MAKVGEGDARWLVADRADGKNVGNWHWTEKSLFPWAKEYLEQKFADYVIVEDEKMKVWFAGVESFKGDMFLHNRKGKTLFVWDVNLFLRWKAIIKGAEEPVHEASGRAECTDITVMDDDFGTKFTIELGDNAQGRELMAIVKANTTKIVPKEFKAMRALMAELHADSAKAGASPGGSGASSPAQASNTSSPAAVSSSPAPEATPSPKQAPASTTATTSSGEKIQVKTISQVVKFETDSKSIFETLLDAGRVSAFTGSAAQISAEKGSAFKLFGGSVLGVTEDVVPGQRIAQKWRFASWPADHYSQVLIEIQDKGGSKCLVKLTQTGVPESDFDRTRIGWEEHFWRRIKGVFGWSYKMKEQ